MPDTRSKAREDPTKAQEVHERHKKALSGSGANQSTERQVNKEKLEEKRRQSYEEDNPWHVMVCAIGILLFTVCIPMQMKNWAKRYCKQEEESTYNTIALAAFFELVLFLLLYKPLFDPGAKDTRTLITRGSPKWTKNALWHIRQLAEVDNTVVVLTVCLLSAPTDGFTRLMQLLSPHSMSDVCVMAAVALVVRGSYTYHYGTQTKQEGDSSTWVSRSLSRYMISTMLSLVAFVVFAWWNGYHHTIGKMGDLQITEPHELLENHTAPPIPIEKRLLKKLAENPRNPKLAYWSQPPNPEINIPVAACLNTYKLELQQQKVKYALRTENQWCPANVSETPTTGTVKVVDVLSVSKYNDGLELLNECRFAQSFLPNGNRSACILRCVLKDPNAWENISAEEQQAIAINGTISDHVAWEPAISYDVKKAVKLCVSFGHLLSNIVLVWFAFKLIPCVWLLVNAKTTQDDLKFTKVDEINWLQQLNPGLLGALFTCTFLFVFCCSVEAMNHAITYMHTMKTATMEFFRANPLQIFTFAVACMFIHSVTTKSAPKEKEEEQQQTGGYFEAILKHVVRPVLMSCTGTLLHYVPPILLLKFYFWEYIPTPDVTTVFRWWLNT